MVEIQNRFAALPQEETDSWDIFKQERNAAAEAFLDTCRSVRLSRRHDWISNITRQLVEEKRAARLAGELTEYKELNSEHALQEVCKVLQAKMGRRES